MTSQIKNKSTSNDIPRDHLHPFDGVSFRRLNDAHPVFLRKLKISRIVRDINVVRAKNAGLG